MDTAHGPRRDSQRWPREKRALQSTHYERYRWGSQNAKGGARCILLVYELRRTRSPVQRVPWELILGHDTYHEI